MHTYAYLCWCMCTFCAGMKASMHGGWCVCAHVCASILARVHACVCAHVGVHIRVCASLHADVHTGVYTCVYAQVGVRTCGCKYAGMCGCVYVFMNNQGLNVKILYLLILT